MTKATESTVYTDGACSNNGYENAEGGWAWASWPHAAGPTDEPQLRESGKESGATNNRMELTAIYNAIRAHPHADIEIRTDSELCIGWITKGWRIKTGKSETSEAYSARTSLIYDTRLLIDSRKAIGLKTRFTKVAGHSSDKRNDLVDKMAVNASKGSTIALRADSETAPPEMAHPDQPLPETGETWRHVKRGTVYLILEQGRLQLDGDHDDAVITVYRSVDTEEVWARLTSEFLDGRFERVEDTHE